MSKSKIGFIIPVYNGVDYLDECLQSIIQQNFEDWSVILIDDCSTDGSLELCYTYTSADKRIVTYENKTRVGPGLSRNIGLEHADSEYVFFMDADDGICQNCLDSLWHVIREAGCPDLIHVHHGEQFGTLDTSSRQSATSLGESLAQSILLQDFLAQFKGRKKVGFCAWQFVFKLDFIIQNKIRFCDAFIWEDNDFVTKVFCYAPSFIIFNKIVYCWRERLSDSLSSSHAGMWYEMLGAALSIFNLYKSAREAYLKTWILQVANSCVIEIEDISASISVADLTKHLDLFEQLQTFVHLLLPSFDKKGIRHHLIKYGFAEAAEKFVLHKKRQALKLVEKKGHCRIYGFPATRKCVRLISPLLAEGFNFIGFFDNDKGKQGQALDGLPIFPPQILASLHNVNEVFVIISTKSQKTGLILANQLKNFGLAENDNFICTGFVDD